MPQLALASFDGQAPASSVLDIGDVLFHHEIFKIEQPGTVDNRGQTVLYPTVWARLKNDWYLLFDLENGDPKNYPVGHVQLTDEYGHANHARAVYVETGRIDPNAKTLTTIPRGHRQQMAVLIDDPDGLGDYVTLAVTEPDGSRRIQRSKIPVWDLTPPPDDNVGKITFSISGGYGSVWLEDGLGADQTDSTGLRSLSGRVTYGFTRAINIEALVTLGWSGEARFSDMTFNNEQGDLIRNVTIGRFQFGGVLRWGDRYMPVLRLGVGVQGTSYDSQFTVGGNRMDGPESSFDTDALWYFGAGVDMRLSKDFFVGLGATWEQLTTNETRSLQAGIHVGYTWKR